MFLLPACSLPFLGDDEAKVGVIPVGSTWTHPTGTTANVSSIEILDSTTELNVKFDNTGPTEIRMDGCCHNSYVISDVGDKFELLPVPGQPGLLIDGETAMQANLVFDGRPTGDAETLTFVFNDRGENGLNDPNTAWPEMRLGPIKMNIVEIETSDGESVLETSPLAGSENTSQPSSSSSASGATQGPINRTVGVNDRFVHANGVIFDFQSIVVDNGQVTVVAKIDNVRRVGVRINGCCDSSYMLDEFGNRYDLVPITTNESLRIERLSAMNVTLVFEGTLAQGADRVQFVFNDRDEGGLTDPETSWPEFRFGPFDLS